MPLSSLTRDPIWRVFSLFVTVYGSSAGCLTLPAVQARAAPGAFAIPSGPIRRHICPDSAPPAATLTALLHDTIGSPLATVPREEDLAARRTSLPPHRAQQAARLQFLKSTPPGITVTARPVETSERAIAPLRLTSSLAATALHPAMAVQFRRMALYVVVLGSDMAAGLCLPWPLKERTGAYIC